MVEKDIQFTVKDEYGNDINCFILACKNISETEINVIYKRDDDDSDTVRYGRIVKDNDKYILTKNVTEVELEELKELLDGEIRVLLENLLEGVVS